MNPIIKFSHNWNSKLYCDCFSTIRLPNEKFKPGVMLDVIFKDKVLCTAEIVYVKDFVLEKITDAMALHDLGYLAKYAVPIMQDIYPDCENISKQVFTYIILEKK